MKIKYFFKPENNDPDAITSITVKADIVPRVSELVDISMQVTKDKKISVAGRVKEVSWYVKNKNSYVCVFLDA